MTAKLGIAFGTAALFLAACTSTHHRAASPQASRSASSPRAIASLSLVPSAPTGSTACGQYSYTITTRLGTTALADCAGLLGLSRVRSISLVVGDEVLLDGLDGVSWTASSPRLVRQRDAHFTMLLPGHIVITAHHVFCAFSVHGTQATTCDAVRITVR